MSLRVSGFVLTLAAPAVLAAQTAAGVQPPARAGQMPTLPMTELDDRAPTADFDSRAFTLTFAQPVPINELLLLLVRGTSLSVIPDPAASESFIGELKNVTVRQALGLILPPLGLDYAVDNGVIRVFRRQRETRLFDIDYVATSRSAKSRVGTDPEASTGSQQSVSSSTTTDLFADLSKGVQTLLSDRATFNVDRKAGLLQVTDFPERLDRVGLYLDAVEDRIHRQVEIEARLLEVELNDSAAQGLDWPALVQAVGGGAPGPRPRSPQSPTRLRVTDPARFLQALSAQGKVTLLANPRLLTLNNEPAIVRTGSLSLTDASGASRGSPSAGDFTLTVTPQIEADGMVMISLSPSVKLPPEEGQGDDQAQSTAVREVDTLARVADGETIVISGLARERVTRERKSVGRAGGWFGRSTVVTPRRRELVILVTPKILGAIAADQ